MISRLFSQLYSCWSINRLCCLSLSHNKDHYHTMTERKKKKTKQYDHHHHFPRCRYYDLSSYNLHQNVNCNEQDRQIKSERKKDERQTFIYRSKQIFNIYLTLLNELTIRDFFVSKSKHCFKSFPMKHVGCFFLLRSSCLWILLIITAFLYIQFT
jgi:uncharacterized Rmd1/YagE family protein